MVYHYDEKLSDSGAYDIKAWKITPDEHVFDANFQHRKRHKKKLLGERVSPTIRVIVDLLFIDRRCWWHAQARR
jgi:hypothetical protein